MKLSITLFSNLLFASAILAAPGGIARRNERRSLTRQGKPIVKVPGGHSDDTINATQVEYSSNWSGAVLTAPPSGSTFTAVSAQFTVPTPLPPTSSGSGSWSSSAWVGIDGDTYQNAILQTGIDFTATRSGSKDSYSFDAWYEWYPDYAYDFSLTVSAGDVIALSVTSTSSTAGKAVIENITTGKTVTKSLTSSYALGGQNAEWIVEDYEENGELVALSDFGTILFEDAVAKTSLGVSEGTTGAVIIDLESEDGTIETSVTIPSSSEVEIVWE